MATKLNRRGYEHAQELVQDGNVVADERDDWSEHAPSTDEENEFIEKHGYGEFGKWFLGIDDEASEDTKGRYKFPYGDFKKIHRCGILAAESRAGQYDHDDIQDAAAHLHGMIEGWQAGKNS